MLIDEVKLFDAASRGADYWYLYGPNFGEEIYSWAAVFKGQLFCYCKGCVFEPTREFFMLNIHMLPQSMLKVHTFVSRSLVTFRVFKEVDTIKKAEMLIDYTFGHTKLVIIE